MLPVEEYIVDKGITVIEWADRLNTKPTTGIHVKIVIDKRNRRELTVEDIRD